MSFVEAQILEPIDWTSYWNLCLILKSHEGKKGGQAEELVSEGVHCPIKLDREYADKPSNIQKDFKRREKTFRVANSHHLHAVTGVT